MARKLCKVVGKGGIVPVSLLSCTPTLISFVSASEGIGPVSWLALTWNDCKFASPASEGIEPDSWLPMPQCSASLRARAESRR